MIYKKEMDESAVLQSPSQLVMDMHVLSVLNFHQRQACVKIVTPLPPMLTSRYERHMKNRHIYRYPV